jgi:hypothetical protein
MSSLAWIDFDETERQRARRLMALFAEKESRDELGLGPIRDSLADHLFPGTSTIQTRLRYMLFVPWLYQLAEKRDGSPDRLAKEAHDLEIRLIDALRTGGEAEGIIGREAGAALKRLPSSIYWAGLRTWGIRTFAGSQEAYFAAIPGLRRHAGQSAYLEDSAAADEERPQSSWRAGLPSPPADFLSNVTFRLTTDEAGFLVDRLVDSRPRSLLTRLAKAGRHAECDFIWTHPDLATFPADIRELIDDARCFSLLMHGASLLYNLMLSEKCQNNDWIQSHGEALAKWQADPDLAALTDWSLTDFWIRVVHPDHRIQEPTRHFVHRWLELVRNGATSSAEMREARDLVKTREMRLKRTQSRFVNQAMLNRWGGNSGSRRLGFRWAEASSHLKDIVDAQ